MTSAASPARPPQREVAALLDDLGLERVAVVGHSSGGWTALELAKLGRASGVLALTPAGLWRKHSPPITDAILVVNWCFGQLFGERIAGPRRLGQQGPNRPQPNLMPHRSAPPTRDHRNLARVRSHADVGRTTTSDRHRARLAIKDQDNQDSWL